MAYYFDHKTNLKPLNLQFRNLPINDWSELEPWPLPEILTIPQAIRCTYLTAESAFPWGRTKKNTHQYITYPLTCTTNIL